MVERHRLPSRSRRDLRAAVHHDRQSRVASMCFRDDGCGCFRNGSRGSGDLEPLFDVYANLERSSTTSSREFGSQSAAHPT
jgi:hypothetical protein